MAFPASFSSTQEGDMNPFLENEMEKSPSCVTVKLASSPSSLGSAFSSFKPMPSSPLAASSSRLVSFAPDTAGDVVSPHRVRVQTDPTVLVHYTAGDKTNAPASPAQPQSQARRRLSTSRMTQSPSMASMMSMMLTRSRSKSMVNPNKGDGLLASQAMKLLPSAGPLAQKTGWFGKACELMRPWGDSENTDDAIPEEQKQAFAETSAAVLATLKKVLGIAGEVALDVLVASASALEHVPVPWLQKIAVTFISIWKAVQKVSMNRIAFLRLVQTCTNILDSIYKEMENADEQVAKDLAAPISALERSFESFLSTVQSQVDTPFLWRYVKRDETLEDIDKCNESLLRALALFTSTIQLRTYQAVCANAKVCAESYRQLKIMAAQVALAGLEHPHSPIPSSTSADIRRASAPDGLPSSSSHRSMTLTASPTIVSRSTDDFFRTPEPHLIPVLEKLQEKQRQNATMLDIEDLRCTIREVLDSGSDSALLSFLQVGMGDIPEAIKTLQRLKEEKGALGDGIENDTLHEEFIEAGIEALRRMSSPIGPVYNLPRWTITRYEIVQGQKIGMGFFSEVFEGRWKSRTVAIKVLSEVTPSDLFVREIKVWKSLNHPNVLKLYGASSATGNPPWFFVSPYMKNGNLVEFLRKISRRDQEELSDLGSIAENLPSSKSRGCYGKGFFKLLKIGDTYRILQEIAKGMEYLHEMGVLHGDLKASNVLVDADFRCVISDFGQSEMKSEFCRITGSSVQTGTLRWKAPELLDGSCMLTTATDIYAYAIVCIEVLRMGELPWGCTSDEDLRHGVLDKDKRPMIPLEFTSPLLHELISACWHRDPRKRIPFSEVVCRLQRLRVIAGDCCDPTGTFDEAESWPASPYLSGSSIASPPTPGSPIFNDSCEFFDCADDFVSLPSPQEVDALRMDEAMVPTTMKMPEPAHYTVNMKIQTSQENPGSPTMVTDGDSDYNLSRSIELGRRSPPPTNPKAALARNERRYRYLLEHEYNSCLNLPLWEPSTVQLGDVGYLSKPSGQFVTLFNALKPPKSAGGPKIAMASMAGYGSISKGRKCKEKRNAAQKGLDMFSELLTFRSKGEASTARRHSFRLRSGHKCAYIYAESAEFHYLKNGDAPKIWFRSHIDQILDTYSRPHNIQKEDVFLVVNMLQVRDYALLVSHNHPDGQAHFHTFSSPRKGQPWGMFTCDAVPPGGRNGPVYDEPEHIDHDYASKISLTSDPPKAVLLGRLRFRPDSMEPTTAK